MVSSVSLVLTYIISYMNLSLCLTTPWAVKNCNNLTCMNTNINDFIFNNECTLEELQNGLCPMLPEGSC
ncbi:unnamed protein product, partial [marine sediment metagenome]